MRYDLNSQPGGDIFIAKITGVASAFTGVVAHAWEEQEFSCVSRSYITPEGNGRTGSLTQEPSFDINGGSFAVGTFVFMRLRGWVNTEAVSLDPVQSGMIYDILGTAGSGATSSFSGAKAFIKGNTYTVTGALEFDGIIFDTDGYITGDGFTDPTGGFYLYGFNIPLVWSGMSADAWLQLEMPGAVATGLATQGFASRLLTVPLFARSSASDLSSSSIGNGFGPVRIVLGGTTVGSVTNAFGGPQSVSNGTAFIAKIK